MRSSINQRVLYLSHDGLTDPLGQSQILPYLKGLSREGYSITVVSFEKQPAFKREGRLIQDECDQVNIRWRPLTYHSRPPVVSTIFDLFILRREVIKLHKKEQFFMVHCRSYLTSLIGTWMKKNYGVKFVFDMRGFWADERVDGGIWSIKNPVFAVIYNFFKRKEKDFVREADCIISLTENARREILSWQRNEINIKVIPTCVDLSLFDPREVSNEIKEKWRAILGLKPTDYVLVYLGSLGTWYMMDEMLLFFEALKRKIAEAKFLIITPDKFNVPDHYLKDTLVVKVGRNEVPALLSLANISVFFIKPMYSKKASAATKMGELLAMGVPVISNSGWGDIEGVITQQNGFLVRDFKLVEYQKIVELLPNSSFNPSELRAVAFSYFDLNLGIKKYLEVYELLQNT